MEKALIGLIGVLIGIILNEMIRRRNRIENYAVNLFERRLEIYEGLYERVSSCSAVASDVIENSEYTEEMRRDIVSESIHSIAGYCDKYDMYINEELAVHCTPLLMGVEDIYSIENDDEKKDAIKRFNEDLRNAKKMIRKEAGIEDIERLFSSITRPKHSSPIIDYYRKKKKELSIKGKWE